MAWLRLAIFLYICSHRLICTLAQKLSPVSPFTFSPNQQAMCAIAVGNSLDSLTEAGVRIWGAAGACAATPSNDSAINSRNRVTCAVDIGDVLVPLAEAAEFTVAIVGDCFHARIPMQRCMEDSFRLAGQVASLVGFAMKLQSQCKAPTGDSTVGVGVEQTTCALDVNDAMESILNLLATAATMQRACKKSATRCAEEVAKGVSELSSVAEYVIAAFEDCSSDAMPGTLCASTSSGLVAATAGIVSAAIGVEHTCSLNPLSTAKRKFLKGVKPYTPPSGETKDALAQTFPDIAKYALRHNMSKASPAAVQASVMSLLRSNLTKLSRLFSVDDSKRRSRIAKDAPAFLFKPSVNTMILGCIPVAALFSFLVGRRSVAMLQE